MAMRALFPGSFDPVTNGHLDLIARLAALMDEVVVGVAINAEKRPLFTVEERVSLLCEVCRPWSNVRVDAFAGLVVEAAQTVDADLLVRRVRNDVDLAHEQQMAYANRALPGIETLLLPASPEWALVSASLVRELARYGRIDTLYVPAPVADRLRARYQKS